MIGDQVVAVIGATVGQALDPDRDARRRPGLPDRGRPARRRPGACVSTSRCRSSSRSPSWAPTADVDYEAIQPYIDGFAALVAGSRVEDGLAHSRVTVSLAGE